MAKRHSAPKPPRTIFTRALAVWLVLIVAEVLHGIARAAFLVPCVGEFRSNQIGVFIGSVIILAISLAAVRWIGATRPAQLLVVGLVWLGLTMAFEDLFGRFVAGLSWERLAVDDNVLEGGLMPLGLLVLLLSSLIAARMRGEVRLASGFKPPLFVFQQLVEAFDQ